ncbi:pre-peptidase C-terminal domain-containing protein [Flocculibacter collagenilyticus]|uniref:pre-peptidase C-terminal domain-containing protein n=1 Tax=Flocculibacter collagenilyticus TaxID=2744479 RepID=UPI0018F3298E|nr:pre-peptidase C-terminal domain-containing protein [Flocculibacter collagenilyticus]
MKKVKLSLLSAALLALGLPAHAATDLFAGEASSAQLKNSLIKKDFIESVSNFNLNKGALDSSTAALDIQLNQKLKIKFTKTKTSKSKSGSFIWQGTALENASLGSRISDVLKRQQNSAILVENNGKITGTVRYDGKLYRIRPTENNIHRVEEINESKMPQDHHDGYVDPDSRPLSKNLPDVSTQANPVINVLVAYTSSAASQSGGINALIDLAITETNNGYSTSGVNASVALVHSYQVNYSEASNSATDLSRLAGTSDGYMDEVHSLRDQYGADMVVLVNDVNGYCGQADAIYANASSAFAIVDYDCATGYYSFGHELGHLQGARHDPANDPTSSPFAYGHGYQDPNQQWRTVMAYNCSSGCTRQLFWSNPNRTHQGRATGTASSSDNTRVLNNTAAEMAAFRGGVVVGNKLENGVPVNNLSASKGSTIKYELDVPSTATSVQFNSSGGSGDMDMYVKFGSQPTTSNYDCRSWTNGNSESCSFSSAQNGTYYVLLNAYSTFSGVSLTGAYTEGSSGSSGSETNLSASQNNWSRYTIDVPAGSSKLEVTITGGSGDADLYLNRSSAPTTSSGTYVCRPWKSGNEETCTINNPAAGTWHVGVHAYSTYSGVTSNWSY